MLTGNARRGWPLQQNACANESGGTKTICCFSAKYLQANWLNYWCSCTGISSQPAVRQYFLLITIHGHHMECPVCPVQGAVAHRPTYPSPAVMALPGNCRQWERTVLQKDFPVWIYYRMELPKPTPAWILRYSLPAQTWCAIASW